MNDREIYIAVAAKASSKQWLNQKMTWCALRDKCMEEHHTSETVDEYARMSKEDKARCKDVGGFVGGYLKDGRRKKENVEFREVLTLDIDHGEPGTWDGFTMAYDNAAYIYSTHSHTDEAPRLRLVVLLSRSVNRDEYEAVGRAVSASLGMRMFDKSTWQAERLMYWPSTPKDGKAVHEYQDGPALDVDRYLSSSYHDWSDVSEWPRHPKEEAVIRRAIGTRMENPQEKQGVVGAFCRIYNVEDAIQTFLSDRYAPAGKNRYTYTLGHVSAGLVLYENATFAFANNETDPCSGREVNAFDLVRIHKFGELDENTDTRTRISERPSYKAMCDLALSDPSVKRLMASERLSEAVKDFDSIEPEEDGEEWKDGLDMDSKGHIKNTANNACLILRESPAFKGKLAYSDFDGKLYALGRLPWRDKGLWRDADNSQLRTCMEKLGITTKDKVKDALVVVADENRFHPIRDYLHGLTWDGKPRLATLFVDFLGAPDNELNRVMTTLQFKAAVARVMTPGCKYDQCLVLTGPQGIGKSTILSKMGGDWFNDSFNTFEGKEAMENVQGSWIIEIGELTALSSARSNESVKAFLSKYEDTFRSAYAETVETRPRQCVFFGTTNDETFLTGDTGNRRWWVISAGGEAYKSVHHDLTPEYRDQLWAEAYELYKNDKSLVLPEEMQKKAESIQESYNVINGDDRVQSLSDFLDRRLPMDWAQYSPEAKRSHFVAYKDTEPTSIVYRNRVTVREVWTEWSGKNIDDLTTLASRRIGALLSRVPGWKKVTTPMRVDGRLCKYWERIDKKDNTENEELL